MVICPKCKLEIRHIPVSSTTTYVCGRCGHQFNVRENEREDLFVKVRKEQWGK